MGASDTGTAGLDPQDAYGLSESVSLRGSWGSHFEKSGVRTVDPDHQAEIVIHGTEDEGVAEIWICVGLRACIPAIMQRVGKR